MQQQSEAIVVVNSFGLLIGRDLPVLLLEFIKTDICQDIYINDVLIRYQLLNIARNNASTASNAVDVVKLIPPNANVEASTGIQNIYRCINRPMRGQTCVPFISPADRTAVDTSGSARISVS
jgi:hypothetical protein